MDIRMPGTRRARRHPRDRRRPARCADVRVIVLTTFTDDAYVFDAIRFGASGFLVKDIEPAELVHGDPGGARRRRRCSPPRVTRR